MPDLKGKQEVVNEIKQKLENASSIVLVSSRGLTVTQDTKLRKELRENGVVYKVYKNTMTRLAVKGTPFEGVTEYLTGPTAIAMSYEDATAGARIINNNLKVMPKLEFKAGIVENTVYDAEGIKAIASIPPRNELLSKLLGSFKSPMASFARLANAIAEKKGEA